jgi:hypothetical protein
MLPHARQNPIRGGNGHADIESAAIYAVIVIPTREKKAQAFLCRLQSF